MNRSHQSVEDKDLSVFDGEENDYGKDDVEEVESPMHDDSYTEEQYTEGPIEGMSFRCVQTTFTFYKEHSHLTGFRVFKKSAKKLAGQLKYVTFGYDKFQKIMARNQSKRVDCKTRVNYQVMNGGSCIVTKVILEHNHELEPALSHFLPFHRELSRMVKRSLVAHDIAGLRPSKRIRLLEVKAGGPERMRCTPKDCRNYILQQWRLRTLSSDTAVLLIFLWICNPRTWLTNIGKIPPTSVLTDQCESTKAVILEVLPNTIHRNCIWHIFTKLPVKLKRVTNYKPAKACFKAIIFNSITIGEFEDKWQEFIEEYDLDRWIWFKSLYSERSKWVPVFIKHFFWASMMSTQRCELIHAFFDGYISGRSFLK
ncbi:hypothetical protein T459_25044 [Capsicum annuum]|uniref:Protein FAR1-RELATED SEQUENCE n=1 Tax=Capsicum annuum TaxID=4072 RepID=A0A2G2YJM5_CAPAN|nr:hypothetical protein T459_35334 [Capsicum annuum]PHT69940.1 hypothetical protein T459_25044 [Capsicum annuum]